MLDVIFGDLFYALFGAYTTALAILFVVVIMIFIIGYLNGSILVMILSGIAIISFIFYVIHGTIKFFKNKKNIK